LSSKDRSEILTSLFVDLLVILMSLIIKVGDGLADNIGASVIETINEGAFTFVSQILQFF
jgi:hypothetical protein